MEGKEMAEGSDVEQHKRLLTVEQQIEHLKSKGLTFELCSEEDAASYLSGHTYYFKLAAYRVLFDKRVGGLRDGQYANLDFGHLKALASLDRDLRYALLPLTLDVEHAMRTKLVRIATEREDEDGYSIARDYIASLNHNERRRRESDVKSLEHDAYCGALVARYGSRPEAMPIWVLMELFSFGSFASLYLFCADRWDDPAMRNEHYMLRQAQFVRNACAHSSNLINGFGAKNSAVESNANVERALARTGLSHRVRTAKMRNPRLKQITTLMYLHSRIIPEGSGRQRANSNMTTLAVKMSEASTLFAGNDAIRSSLDFLTKIVDSWFQ